MSDNVYIDGIKLPTSDLLPCPFCGGKADIVVGFRSSHASKGMISHIDCNDCGAQGEKFDQLDCKDKAIKAWNKRI